MAAAASPARAQDPCCAPKTRTIQVVECHPEKFQERRTVCRVECRREVYDTFRCECVPVVRERVCHVVHKVPVTTVEVRRVCVPVFCYEDRVCMKPCWETRTVTCVKKKCVSRGHWETCEVPTLLSKLGDVFRKDCCDPCCEPRCPKTRCKKCWVPCPVYVDCPVTRCQKVCVMKPVHCRVKVCRMDVREVQVQRCSYRCETVQRVEKYTTYETRKVPVKAERTVSVVVPHSEDVWVTRMVPRVVEREVAVAEHCDSCCPPARCGLGLRLRLRSDCCH